MQIRRTRGRPLPVKQHLEHFINKAVSKSEAYMLNYNSTRPSKFSHTCIVRNNVISALQVKARSYAKYFCTIDYITIYSPEILETELVEGSARTSLGSSETCSVAELRTEELELAASNLQTREDQETLELGPGWTWKLAG